MTDDWDVDAGLGPGMGLQKSFKLLEWQENNF